MTEWKKETFGQRYPDTLERVSPDTYIQRKDIQYVETQEGDMESAGGYESMSRFISVEEYNLITSLADTVQIKQEADIIDAYTLKLLEEGVI